MTTIRRACQLIASVWNALKYGFAVITGIDVARRRYHLRRARDYTKLAAAARAAGLPEQTVTALAEIASRESRR